jgi:hypothetical protein
MTAISQYSLGQIKALIPPKLRQQWDRLPANTALIGGALIAALGIGYLGYRWATATSLQATNHAANMATTSFIHSEYNDLSSETMSIVKRVVENTPVAVYEGQIVNIRGHELMIVLEENNSIDLYTLNKNQFLGSGGNGNVRKLFSLTHNTWGKAMKTPLFDTKMHFIENAITMVGLVNPDGKTRGCIKKPYRIIEIDATGQPKMRGILMDAYDTDAAAATRLDGIIRVLRENPDFVPYFVDMVHQGLSVLAKLQETGICHMDITYKNIFISRRKDGFFDFHLGDWDGAWIPKDGEQKWHRTDICSMYYIFYCIAPSTLPPPIDNILPLMSSGYCDIGQVLKQLNQSLAWAAKPDAPPIWQHVAKRAGIVDGGSV